VRASDQLLHAQLTAIAESARAAIAGDRLIVIASFWDDEVGNTANMTTYDSKDPDDSEAKEASELVHLVLQSAASIVASTGLEFGVRFPGGEWKKFNVADPHSVAVDLEELARS
jgi:hypothetical protein